MNMHALIHLWECHFVDDTYPISKKMLRNSSRTFNRGWKAPPFVGTPAASKLYFLNVAVFQEPLTGDNWLVVNSTDVGEITHVRCYHIRRQVRLWLFERYAEVGALLYAEPLPLPEQLIRSKVSAGTDHRVLLSDKFSFAKCRQRLFPSFQCAS